MMIKKSLFALLALAASLAGSINAEAGVSLVGALNYGLNSETGTDPATGLSVETKGGLGFGGGLLLDFGMGGASIEVGGLFLSKSIKSTTTVLGIPIEDSVNASSVHVPVMVRFGGMTSFGVGGFFEASLESGGGTDYGVVGGPRFSMPGGLFFDGRFAYGLKDGNSMNAMLLVGFKFGGK